VSAGQDAVCWDVAHGREIARFPTGPNVTATFRPIGGGLITFGQETRLLRWAPGADSGRASGACQFRPPHTLQLRGGAELGNERACWSADGRLLAVVDGAKREVVILDGDSGNERKRLRPDPLSPPMVRLALSPDGRWAAAGHHQGQSPYLPAVVTVWEVASGRSRTLPGSLPGDHVAFSPDGRWLVVGGGGDYRSYPVRSWQAGPPPSPPPPGSPPGPPAPP